MMKNEMLDGVLGSLVNRSLGTAISMMESFQASHPRLNDADRLLAIRTDFQMMADYWRRGYKDPQLGGLYENLLQRMYRLYANTAHDYAVTHSSFLQSVRSQTHQQARDLSPQNIREELETYVSEMAMLELEPENKRQARRQEICRRHQEELARVFNYLWTSAMWTDGMASAMEEILLLPTVDSNDQQVLVSAVMLSAMNQFDIAKFRMLVNVYRKTADVAVRQRALVGWVFSLNSDIGQSIFPEENRLVEELLENQECCRELVELQKQMVFCVNAEQDNQKIQQEIMPELMKGNNLRVMRNGIEEIEEDPLADILHADEQERKLEKMEESFQKMIDMQKQGSDIYFGGFSQMKRFSFFARISNWFVPFTFDHPDIGLAVEKFRNNRFLKTILQKGPFCSSDKYSFLLAFEQVLERLPQNMREMLDRGEATIGEMEQGERQSPLYLRRLYLQDLYRFFRLYPQRREFVNPFDAPVCIFFADPIFSRTHLELSFNEVSAFLMKQKRMQEAGAVLSNCGEPRRDFQFYIMAGYITQHHYFSFDGGEGLDDLACYRRALELQPDHERALTGYARACFVRNHYEEALDAYDRLLKTHAGKKSYQLNRAVCLIKLERYADALKVLYKLNYEQPTDVHVSRVLAWALTCDEKYEQAEKIYGQLLSAQALPDDLLNYGYCLWFAGSIDEAADCFHRYLKETGQPSSFIPENEAALIRQKGITEPEMQMMLYLL